MLGDAVVSVEDEHFYANFLVNVAAGAGRAALGVLQTNGDPGGSTIDRQLAKQLYGGGDGLGGTLRAIALGQSCRWLIRGLRSTAAARGKQFVAGADAALSASAPTPSTGPASSP